jgi:hypothetical protein
MHRIITCTSILALPTYGCTAFIMWWFKKIITHTKFHYYCHLRTKFSYCFFPLFLYILLYFDSSHSVTKYVSHRKWHFHYSYILVFQRLPILSEKWFCYFCYPCQLPGCFKQMSLWGPGSKKEIAFVNLVTRSLTGTFLKRPVELKYRLVKIRTPHVTSYTYM